MATITWRGGSSGDWATQTNWSGFAVPRPGDDVVIGNGITVTIDTPGIAANDVSLGAGAALLLTGTLDLGGVLAGGSLALSGELTGTGTLESPLDGLGGTVDSVDVAYGQGIGGVTITPATGAASTTYPIEIVGTLTLAAGSYDGAFAVGTFPTSYNGENWYDLAVAGNVTLGPDANVVLGHLDGVTYVGPALIGATGTDTLTNEGTISGGSDYAITISPATFINSGTVALTLGSFYGSAFWTILEFDSGVLRNSGLLSDAGGKIFLNGATVFNSGSIVLPGTTISGYGPGQLFVADTVTSFVNTGTISAGTIGFAGSVTLPDLGDLQGAVTIYGELGLAGGTLDAGAYGAGLTVTGTVRDGTLTANGGTLTLKGATLYDTTVVASANVVAIGPITLIDPPDGTSVTLDGTTTELSFTSGDIADSLTITAGNQFVNDTIDVATGSATLGTGSAFTQVAGLVQIQGNGTLRDDGGIAVEAGTLAVSALLTGGYFVALAPDATMVVSGTLGGDGTIALADGAGVTIDALAAGATPTIAFSSSAALAVLPGSAAGVTLSGLKVGDLIDFAGLSSAGSGTAMAQLVGGTLEVVAASGQTAELAATDAAVGLTFSVIGDGGGGSLVRAIQGPPLLTAATAFDNTPGTDYGSYVLSATTLTDGAITVEGSYTVDLLAGALWLTGAITFGPGIGGDTDGGGLLTLSGGVADGGTLAASGALLLGEDPGTTPTNAPGVGGLTAQDGATITAFALTLENGATIAVDATSAVVIGDAAATAGALTIAAGTTLYDTIGTISGNVIDAGVIVLNITPNGANGTLTVTGDLTLSSSLVVDALTSLAVSGTLTLLDGASFSAEHSTSSSTTLAVQSTTWVSMLMQQGAVLDTNALTIAQGSLDVQGSGGGGITVAGAIVLGADAGPDSGAGVGTLALSEATLTASNLSVFDGSSIVNDAGALVLGNATETSNAITIGQGGTLSVDVGTIDGPVIDDGSLVLNGVSVDGGSAPGALTINDGASGGGLTIGSVLTVGDPLTGVTTTLDVASSVSVAPGGALAIDGGTLIAGTLIGGGAITLHGTETLGAVSDLGTVDVNVGQLTMGGTEFSGMTFDNILYSVIDLPDVAFSTAFGEDTRSVSIGGGTFEVGVTDAGPTQQMKLFTQRDGHGGTRIVAEVPCFAAGTGLLTEHGAVPVEALRPGDRLRTTLGRLAPVRWVGCTRVDLARHPHPERAAPIRVAAGAIAPGVPARDVLLSRDHALFLGGALVPVWQLANGASIARQDGLASVTYYHVELDRHDIILADGMAAESYLDTGNRGVFAGAGEVRPLHADFAAPPDMAALRIWAEHGAAPLLLGGDTVAAERKRLLTRALALGWVRGHHPGLTVLANGTALPARRGDAGWRVRLPARTASARLCSSSFVPAERDRASGDMRRLGVAVAALRLGGKQLAADCLRAGWHAPDTPAAAWRWTDGDARLVLPPLPRAATLDIGLAYAEQYWQPPHAAETATVPAPTRQSRKRQNRACS